MSSRDDSGISDEQYVSPAKASGQFTDLRNAPRARYHSGTGLQLE